MQSHTCSSGLIEYVIWQFLMFIFVVGMLSLSLSSAQPLLTAGVYVFHKRF